MGHSHARQSKRRARCSPPLPRSARATSAARRGRRRRLRRRAPPPAAGSGSPTLANILIVVMGPSSSCAAGGTGRRQQRRRQRRRPRAATRRSQRRPEVRRASPRTATNARRCARITCPTGCAFVHPRVGFLGSTFSTACLPTLNRRAPEAWDGGRRVRESPAALPPPPSPPCVVALGWRRRLNIFIFSRPMAGITICCVGERGRRGDRGDDNSPLREASLPRRALGRQFHKRFLTALSR